MKSELEDMKLTLDMMQAEYDFLSQEKDSVTNRLAFLAERIKDKQHEIYIFITEEYKGDK